VAAGARGAAVGGDRGRGRNDGSAVPGDSAGEHARYQELRAGDLYEMHEL
jgi:hypothetical protein